MNAKRQLSGLKRVDFSKKTDKQIIKYLLKKYELLGYAIPNYLKGKTLTKRQLNQAINKITNGLNSTIKRESKATKTKTNANTNKFAEELKSINDVRNQLEPYSEVNAYNRRALGEYQSLAELNEQMWYFKDLNRNITLKDIQKIAKKQGRKSSEYIDILMEKITKFDFNTYRGLLEFYGFKKEAIDKMAKEFNSANYKRKDYLLETLHRYAKGKDKYPTEEEESEKADHQVSRDNFTIEFDNIIKGGKGWHGEEIDLQ